MSVYVAVRVVERVNEFVGRMSSRERCHVWGMSIYVYRSCEMAVTHFKFLPLTQLSCKRMFHFFFFTELPRSTRIGVVKTCTFSGIM